MSDNTPDPIHPDPTPVLDLIEAFRRSKTMFAAVELGVFDGMRPPGGDGPPQRGPKSSG